MSSLFPPHFYLLTDEMEERLHSLLNHIYYTIRYMVKNNNNVQSVFIPFQGPTNFWLISVSTMSQLLLRKDYGDQAFQGQSSFQHPMCLKNPSPG